MMNYQDPRDIQQQPIVDHFHSKITKLANRSARVLLPLLLMGVVLHTDLGSMTEKKTNEQDRSLIKKTKDVIDTIIIELKKGLNPPYH